MVMKGRTRKSERNHGSDGPASLLTVNADLLDDLTAVFKLLADRNRLKIVLALAARGQMHVNALCELLGQSQPAVSHHLTLMRMVGLVGYDRSGKHNFYYLASDHLRELFEQFFSDTGNTRQALEFEDFALVFSRRERS
jgi:ArsR family transcriptional regulator, arsenate/arsenite/antimonite-responsive transcriptional repressor